MKKGEENKVSLLKKSLYGLKQSPRQWNRKFDAHMTENGFTRSKYDDCVYIKKKERVPVAYLLIYVDDILIAGPSKHEVQIVKDDLNQSFEMKDLGEAKRILGMDIMRNREKGTLWLSQADYVEKVLKRFNMINVKPAATPIAQHFKLSKAQVPGSVEESKEMESIPYANIIGSLMYAMICTRPDISHAVSITSRYMSDFGREHWSALKWMLRYLRGAGNFGILYKGCDETETEILQGFCDADYATNLDNRKSQTGYVFTMFGSAISWKSSLQSVVALSTTEAEYIALTSAVKESFWIKGMAAEFEVEQDAVTIHCDSSSALCLARHQVFHERSKHIDVRLHFIRDEVEKGNAKVVKISTLHNPADMLTKALPKEKFEHCKELINVCAMV